MLSHFRPWVSVHEDVWRKLQAIEFERMADAKMAAARALAAQQQPAGQQILAAQLASDYQQQKKKNRTDPIGITKRLIGNIKQGELLDAGGNLLEYLNLPQEYVGKPLAGWALRGFEEKVDPRTGLEYRDINWRDPKKLFKGYLKGLGQTAGDVLSGDLIGAYQESREAYTEGIEQNPHVWTGVKVGLGILTDPTTYLGPGVVKAVALRVGLKGGKLIGLLDNLLTSPRAYGIGASIGGGLAAQASEEFGASPELQGLFTFGGAMLGGGLSAGVAARGGVSASVKEAAVARELERLQQIRGPRLAKASLQLYIDRVELEKLAENLGVNPDDIDQLTKMGFAIADDIVKKAQDAQYAGLGPDFKASVMRKALSDAEQAVDDAVGAVFGNTRLADADVYILGPNGEPLTAALGEALAKYGYKGKAHLGLATIMTPAQMAKLTTINPHAAQWYALVGRYYLNESQRLNVPFSLFSAIWASTTAQADPVKNLSGTYRWLAVLLWAERNGHNVLAATPEDLLRWHDELLEIYPKAGELPAKQQMASHLVGTAKVAQGEWRSSGLKAITFGHSTEAAGYGFPAPWTVADRWEVRPYGLNEGFDDVTYLIVDRLGQHLAGDLGLTPDMRQAGMWSGLREFNKWGFRKEINGRKLGDDWLADIVDDVKKGELDLNEARAMVRTLLDEFLKDVQEGKVQFEDPVAFLQSPSVRPDRELLEWVVSTYPGTTQMSPAIMHDTPRGGFLGRNAPGNRLRGPEELQAAQGDTLMSRTAAVRGSVMTADAEMSTAQMAQAQMESLQKAFAPYGGLSDVTEYWRRVFPGREDVNAYTINSLAEKNIRHVLLVPTGGSVFGGTWTEGGTTYFEPNYVLMLPGASRGQAQQALSLLDEALTKAGMEQSGYGLWMPEGKRSNVTIAVKRETPWEAQEVKRIAAALEHDVVVDHRDPTLLHIIWWDYEGAASAPREQVAGLPAALAELGYTPRSLTTSEGQMPGITGPGTPVDLAVGDVGPVAYISKEEIRDWSQPGMAKQKAGRLYTPFENDTGRVMRVATMSPERAQQVEEVTRRVFRALHIDDEDVPGADVLKNYAEVKIDTSDAAIQGYINSLGPNARALWESLPEELKRDARALYLLSNTPDAIWKNLRVMPDSNIGLRRVWGDYVGSGHVSVIRIATEVLQGKVDPSVFAHELTHHIMTFLTPDELNALYRQAVAELYGGGAKVGEAASQASDFLENTKVPSWFYQLDAELQRDVRAYTQVFAEDYGYRWTQFSEWLAERFLDEVFGRDVIIQKTPTLQRMIETARHLFAAILRWTGILGKKAAPGSEPVRTAMQQFVARIMDRNADVMRNLEGDWNYTKQLTRSTKHKAEDLLNQLYNTDQMSGRARMLWDPKHQYVFLKEDAGPGSAFKQTMSGQAGEGSERPGLRLSTEIPALSGSWPTMVPEQPPEPPRKPPPPPREPMTPEMRMEQGRDTLFVESKPGGLQQTVQGRPVEGPLAKGLDAVRQRAAAALARLETVQRVNPNLGRKDQISQLVNTARQGFRNVIDTYEGYADLLWTRVQAAGLEPKFDGSQWVLEGGGSVAPFGDVAEAAIALSGKADIPPSLHPDALRVAQSLTPQQRSALAALAEFNNELNYTLWVYSGEQMGTSAYFPRYVAGVDGTPRVDLREFTQGSSKIRTHSTFMEPREFISQLEGSKAGIEYAHPAKAYRLMVRAKLNVAAGDYIASKLKAFGMTEDAVREAGGVPGVTHVDLGGIIPSLSGVYFDGDTAERILAGLKGHDQWRVPALSKVNEVLTPLRAVADLSWMLQQGAMLLFRHPMRAVPAIVRTIRSALGDPQQYVMMMEEAIADGARRAGMSTDEYVKLLGSHGLHLAASDIGELDIGFKQGGVPVWREVKTFSNETYARYLNYARVVMANDVVERAIKTGDMEGLRGGLEAVNRMFGFTSRNPTSLEKTLFFAPRFLSAAVEQILAAATKGGLEGSVARRHLATLIGVGTTLAVAANSIRGYDTELDPRDPNFLRIRNVGGLDVSLFGTYSTLIRAIARAATGDRNAIGGFLEGKLSPALQLIYYPLKGRTYLGEPLTMDKPLDAAYKLGSSAIPFSAQSILQEGIEPAIEERSFRPLLSGAISVLASGTGATNTPLTPVERRNFARTGSKGGFTFAGEQVIEGKVQKQGVAQREFGKDYEDLTAAEKSKVNRSPEVQKWQQEADRNALTRKGERSKYLELKLNAKAQIEELGQELLSGRISGNQYRERYQDIQMRLAGARDMLEETKGDKVLSEWFALYDKARGPGGILDFEKLEQLQSEFRQKHPDVDEKLLKEVGVSDDPVLAAYRAAQKVAQKYFALPRWKGMTREESERASQVLAAASAMVSYGQARSTRQAILALTQNDPELRRLALRAARSRPNPDREKMRKSEPLLALFYSELAGVPRALPAA